MIDKKDLRIGNSVMYKGEAWKVEELADTAAHISQHPLWVRGHYENLEPIPITEEALVKMGWKEYTYTKRDEISISYERIFIHDNGFYFHPEKNSFVYGLKSIYINSIHSLQNAIYALTQTELSYD